MSKLPIVSGQDVVKALAKSGYQFDHQRGSHIVLRRAFAPFRRVTIPKFLSACLNMAMLKP